VDNNERAGGEIDDSAALPEYNKRESLITLAGKGNMIGYAGASRSDIDDGGGVAIFTERQALGLDEQFVHEAYHAGDVRGFFQGYRKQVGMPELKALVRS
jgi:hypothetical protein